MKPTKSICDPTFRYVDSTHTNIRILFERVRAEQAIATFGDGSSGVMNGSVRQLTADEVFPTWTVVPIKRAK